MYPKTPGAAVHICCKLQLSRAKVPARAAGPDRKAAATKAKQACNQRVEGGRNGIHRTPVKDKVAGAFRASRFSNL
jgi:hypothetical protein